jgi:hypothetical protein
MQGFPVQSETIQIASVGGERRTISVSGLSKARLFWLFRNFRILDFSVLNSKQQKLIARAWYTGKRADAADDPFALMGTIDGFLPKLYPPSVSTAKPNRSPESSSLSSGLRTPAVWTAVVLLLGLAIYLVPKQRFIPQHPVAAATTNPVSAPVLFVPPIPAQVSPPVTQLPVAAPEPLAVAPTVSPRHLPDAMASVVSSLQGTQPETQGSTKPAGRREVRIRVSVNHQGRAERFEVLQGDRMRIAAALIAAQAWHFLPCSSAEVCEHTLRITNYGDASIVQMID